jgi:uncharacterized protein YbjT (DUF2867 family)
MVDNAKLVLLTGATGYVGGRLLKALEAAGWQVRCLARHPEFLQPKVAKTTQVVKGDVLDPQSVQAAMEGVHMAYYLVHSMASGAAFEEADRRAATGFAYAARKAGVQRIVYLGGLGSDDQLSSHLASRQEVGRILRESGVPTIEFRASIIIGSGSLSFEMIRALVDKLPIMIIPRWARTRTQCIAIEDVIAYLMATLAVPWADGGVFEIGGADQSSYLDVMKEYARQRSLRRIMISVPVLTPWLSSLWLGLVTPIYAKVGRQLIEGLRSETVVKENSAPEVFGVRPRGFREAISRALENEEQEFAQTRWSDALSSKGFVSTWGGVRFGSRLVDSRTVHVPYPLAQAFRPIQRIGGQTGWYYGNWLWGLRGFIDLGLGGVGMRRGRRHPKLLAPGETIDFWRVEAIEPNHLLRLFAEMKLPGRAWLQFEVKPEGAGSTIRQTAIFDPAGVIGLLYWYALYPVHNIIFSGMLRSIAKAVEKQCAGE